METQTDPTASPTSNREITHRFCGICNPAPALGDTVIAVCGTPQIYLGTGSHDVAPAASDCVVCAELVTARRTAMVLDCGH